MALDGKAIKEEIPDKEVYDSSGSARRAKGELILITHQHWEMENFLNFYLPPN